MKTIICGKSIFSVLIVIITGVFLCAAEALAASYYIIPAEGHDYGETETTYDFTLYNSYGNGLVGVNTSPPYYPSWVDVDPHIAINLSTCPRTITVSVDRAGLVPGTYQVELDFKSNGLPVEHVYLPISMTVPTPPTYSIEGYVKWDNDDPIAGEIVTINSRSATTGADGKYTLTGCLAGRYTITPPDGYIFNPTEYDFNLSGDVTGKTFTARTHSIGGHVREGGLDGTPIEGVKIYLNDVYTTDTIEDGTYIIEDLPNGDYEVTASYSDYDFSPSPYEVTLDNADAGNTHFYTYNIGGRVSRYGTDTGARDMTITVTKDGEAMPYAETTTEEDGSYEFEHISGGTYNVEASNP